MPVVLDLSCYSGAHNSCFSHALDGSYVDFSTALQRQNLCLVHHLLPQASFFTSGDSSLETLSGHAFARQLPEAPSPHAFQPPAACWPAPYLYLYHSTPPGLKSRIYSAYHSCCSVNSVRKSLILYLLFQQTIAVSSLSSC